jgi:hypothetical protein
MARTGQVRWKFGIRQVEVWFSWPRRKSRRWCISVASPPKNSISLSELFCTYNDHCHIFLMQFRGCELYFNLCAVPAAEAADSAPVARGIFVARGYVNVWGIFPKNFDLRIIDIFFLGHLQCHDQSIKLLLKSYIHHLISDKRDDCWLVCAVLWRYRGTEIHVKVSSLQTVPDFLSNSSRIQHVQAEMVFINPFTVLT